MASSASDSDNSVESGEANWKLAKTGIDLLINNKGKEAEELFLKHADFLPMYAGYSIVVFMDALMTFEDDKLELAMSVLKEAEKKCSLDRGWFKSVKSKVFGSDITESLAEYLESQIILADSLVFLSTLTFLQQDLTGYFKGGWILRKSWKLYQSTYTEISKIYKELVGDPQLPDPNLKSPSPTHLNEETANNFSDSPEIESLPSVKDLKETEPETSSLNGYRPCSSPYPDNTPHTKQSISCHSNLSSIANDSPTKSCKGFVHLSDPKIKNGYSTTHSSHTLKDSQLSVNKYMKKSISYNSALFRHTDKNKNFALKLSPFSKNISLSYFTSTFNIFSSIDKLKTYDIDKDTITRLMGAVCFGYGLFQLGVSLLPPTLLKITNILGFSGNRQIGIENLMFARLGTDMRAPLATLALLWYHTIVRPFYALDGSNVQAGVDSATQLINESLNDYGESALFLFFKGRVDRLKSDIPSALECFQKSVENATQREMKILSKHELGWCHLIQLDFVRAETTFHYMKTCSRWSRSFYAYLATISAGTYNNFKDISQLEQMRDILEKAPKGTQLEEFLLRRFRICPSNTSVLMNTSAIFWRMLVYELLYLWNTLPSCNSNSISKILAECEFSKEEEVMIGLGKLISGVCYCIQKKFDRGIHNFRYCLDLRKSLPNNASDAHISAFAQYELGLLLLRNDDTRQEGKNLLQQVGQYKDYDFEQRLSVRIHMILKHL